MQAAVPTRASQSPAWHLGAAFPVLLLMVETTCTGRERQGHCTDGSGSCERPHLLWPLVRNETTQTPMPLSSFQALSAITVQGLIM